MTQSCPWGLTEDVEGGRGGTVVPGRGLDKALVEAGVGGGDPREGEILGRAGAQPHLVAVPGVAQHVLVPSCHQTGEGGIVPFLHVWGRPDPDPGGCTRGKSGDPSISREWEWGKTWDNHGIGWVEKALGGHRAQLSPQHCPGHR